MSQLKTPCDIDDILRRLTALESSVAAVRAQVSALAAVIPCLATKVDLIDKVGSVRVEIVSLRAHLNLPAPHLFRASPY